MINSMSDSVQRSTQIRFLLVASLFLTSCFFSMNISAKVKFAQSQLQTDFKITHPVSTANLLGLESDQLIIIGENEQKQTLLAIYQLNFLSRSDKQDKSENLDSSKTPEKRYTEISRVIIPDNFLAYDLLKIKEKQKLIFQTDNSLMEYDPANNEFKPFSDSHSIYQQTKAQFLSSRNFIDDVNGDKLDDITIVDFSGVHFLLQNSQGEFIQQTLPVKPKIQINQDSATFSETPLFFADINQDKKKDLIVVKNAGLEIFHQNGDGSFKSTAHNLQLPIDVNELNWWEIRESDGESMDQNELSHRTMHQIEDLNNDQISDLLVRFSQSEGVLDRQNNYEIYLGKLKDGKVVYSQTPDSVISASGTIAGMNIVDVDGDKKSEIMVASIDIGVSQIIGALLSGSIDQDILIFKMDESDRFNSKPDVDKEVELNFSLSSGQSGEPVVKLADFDGDGLKDLMFSDGSKTLKVYQGNNKKGLFKKRSVKHKVQLPKDGALLETTDLDKNGKQDVVIRYGRQDAKELNNKLVFLFAE